MDKKRGPRKGSTHYVYVKMAHLAERLKPEQTVLVSGKFALMLNLENSPAFEGVEKSAPLSFSISHK